MKRFVSMIVIIGLLLSFSSCGKSKTDGIKVYEPGDSEDSIKANQLDAFAGLDITITGISPFCDVSINTSGCSSEVQQNVSFKTDKGKYANGDKITVTAQVKSDKTNFYSLVTPSKQFDVLNMPEYISSVDGLDLSTVKKERDDYVTAKCAEVKSSDKAFGEYVHWGWQTERVLTKELKDTYMLSLKSNKREKYNSNTNYQRNAICFLYHIVFITNDGKKQNVYVNISAQNIVKYPDGTIKWGSKSADDFDFQASVSDKSIEDVVATSITSMSADYDIKKITG